SSHIDRSMSADDSELNVESLIKNLKNVIMKELSVPCVARSFMSLSTSSVPFSAASSQSSTPAPVSSSPAPAISVPVTLTPATPGFTTSAFVISSPHFKKMLCRLNESHLSFYFALISETILIEDDNATETTLFYSQASSVTFSSFSAEKVVSHSSLISL
ncbi:hypothetical protein BDFG_02060, partial [Blastomyces dermatitidis ATCC 26199]